MHIRQALVGQRVLWKGRWHEVAHYSKADVPLEQLKRVLVATKAAKGLCADMLSNAMALEQAQGPAFQAQAA